MFFTVCSCLYVGNYFLKYINIYVLQLPSPAAWGNRISLVRLVLLFAEAERIHAAEAKRLNVATVLLPSRARQYHC
jgi:hypothetical protein